MTLRPLAYALTIASFCAAAFACTGAPTPFDAPEEVEAAATEADDDGKGARDGGTLGVRDAAAADATVLALPGTTFKLYPDTDVAIDPSCDVHTVLELSANKAVLREAVTGSCGAVEPLLREYPLTLSEEECGAKTFTGSTRMTTPFEANLRITLTDNRARTCGKSGAKIVVEEDQEGEGTFFLFSQD